jgi:hypothetical protein
MLLHNREESENSVEFGLLVLFKENSATCTLLKRTNFPAWWLGDLFGHCLMPSACTTLLSQQGIVVFCWVITSLERLGWDALVSLSKIKFLFKLLWNIQNFELHFIFLLILNSSSKNDEIIHKSQMCCFSKISHFNMMYSWRSMWLCERKKWISTNYSDHIESIVVVIIIWFGVRFYNFWKASASLLLCSSWILIFSLINFSLKPCQNIFKSFHNSINWFFFLLYKFIQTNKQSINQSNKTIKQRKRTQCFVFFEKIDDVCWFHVPINLSSLSCFEKIHESFGIL